MRLSLPGLLLRLEGLAVLVAAALLMRSDRSGTARGVVLGRAA